MFLIGLTGGIAAGKSTVAKLWESLGAHEIDADVIAREVVGSGTDGANAIAREFGKEFFDEAGNLNRQALGKLVFEDPSARQKLESIVHPLVKDRVKQLLSEQPKDAIIVYTVPLLVEANVDLPFDAVVTVEAPEDTRIQRLVESRGYSPEEAKSRIHAQATPIARAQRADYILNSNQSIDLLKADAKALFDKLRRQAGEKN